MRRVAIALCLVAAGCGSVSQSVSTPPVKPASETGAYTPAQLAAARARLSKSPCPPRSGWFCGIILTSAVDNDDNWVATVVREDGVVDSLSNGWNGEVLDATAAVNEYPPGVEIRWSRKGNDNLVEANEIEVIG